MRYLDEAAIEILYKCRTHNAHGEARRNPQLTERASGWLESLRQEQPEAADLLTEYALGRTGNTQEQMLQMMRRLEELDGDV